VGKCTALGRTLDLVRIRIKLHQNRGVGVGGSMGVASSAHRKYRQSLACVSRCLSCEYGHTSAIMGLASIVSMPSHKSSIRQTQRGGRFYR
jgi:hypothetical protein